jgi:hypothetical protein
MDARAVIASGGPGSGAGSTKKIPRSGARPLTVAATSRVETLSSDPMSMRA